MKLYNELQAPRRDSCGHVRHFLYDSGTLLVQSLPKTVHMTISWSATTLQQHKNYSAAAQELLCNHKYEYMMHWSILQLPDLDVPNAACKSGGGGGRAGSVRVS